MNVEDIHENMRVRICDESDSMPDWARAKSFGFKKDYFGREATVIGLYAGAEPRILLWLNESNTLDTQAFWFFSQMVEPIKDETTDCLLTLWEGFQ